MRGSSHRRFIIRPEKDDYPLSDEMENVVSLGFSNNKDLQNV
jgi:hypothetical protein